MPLETNSREAVRLARLERQIGHYAARQAAIRANCLHLFLIARVLQLLELRSTKCEKANFPHLAGKTRNTKPTTRSQK